MIALPDGTEHSDFFLSLEELLTLFPLLKKYESILNIKQRQILVKIEKNLYENLSIAEIESYLGGGS